jgi:SWI/SNF-related matrix-associated actin-dependent regulator of chromatin subfamily A3
LADIGALFAFIRAHPFDSLATFKRYISIPFEESKERRATACHSLTLLLDSICLRRTKDLLNLPDRVDRLRELEFTEEERNQYEQTKRTMNRALRQRVGESFVKSRFGMFQVQLQLRILCNHGTFQHPFSWARRSLMDEREDALCTIGNLREVRCSACRQCMPVLESNNIYRTDNANCGHMICVECLGDGIEQANESANPLVRCPLCLPGGSLKTNGKTRNKAANGASHDGSYFQPQGHSSKMDALMADVRQDLESTKRYRNTTSQKDSFQLTTGYSIIFSSWTNTLNLVGMYLKKESIDFYRIDGDCPLPVRQKILDDFANSKDRPVLIMTTGTGAFG